MQNRFIICDPDKCTGCGICELACSATKEKTFNPLYSRIRTVRLAQISEPVATTSFSCFHCEDPPCVRFCCAEHGNKALSVDEKTGIIVVDDIMPRGSVCQECGWCMVACEFGAISLDPKTRIAIVCDLCPEEEEPPCVKYCPKDALSLATIEEAMQKTENETAKRLLKVLSQARKDSKTFYERLGFTPMTIRKLNKQAKTK